MFASTERAEAALVGRDRNTRIMGLWEIQRIKKMEADLKKGREIQQSFLPAEMPHVSNWDIATFFSPADDVAGDFYDVFELSEGLLCLVIADVSGKGVGAALYMALIRSLVRVFFEQIFTEDVDRNLSQPNIVIEGNLDVNRRVLKVAMQTNKYLVCNHGHDGMFATMFIGVLSPVTGSLVYINCGHEPLFLVGANGVKEELRPTGPVIGVMDNLDMETRSLQLEPGDLLFGFTDGVTEAFNSEKMMFTRNRVKEILVPPINSAKGIVARVLHHVYDFVGKEPPSDDITLLAVQRIA